MSSNRVIEDQDGTGNRWWLPVLLALLIVAIIGGVLLARNKHIFGGSATATPVIVTATSAPVTATPKPGPTGTPKAGPTGTPRPGGVRPGPTGTPRPGPTGTPRPGPTATPSPTPGG